MTYTEERVRVVAAPALVLWEVIAAFGGDTGYHAFDAVWRFRAAVDRAIGGPGMRGRPHDLATGDELDFWRVEAVESPHRLLLRSEMRMPGTARLQLSARTLDDSTSRLVQHTWFDPSGPVGHAFWWAELPAHKAVFARMVSGIAKAAEARVS